MYILSIMPDEYAGNINRLKEWSESLGGKIVISVLIFLLILVINFFVTIILEFISEKIVRLPLDTIILVNTGISLLVFGYIISTKIIDISNLNIPDFLINPKILAAGIAVGIILRLLCLIIDRYGINEKWETVSSVIDIVGSIVFFAVFVLFTVYLIKK